MDKLIHYANQDGRLNVFYSTPAAYTAAKHSYNHSWPLKTDDYFPYADNEWSYWTGLFAHSISQEGSLLSGKRAASYDWLSVHHALHCGTK